MSPTTAPRAWRDTKRQARESWIGPQNNHPAAGLESASLCEENGGTLPEPYKITFNMLEQWALGSSWCMPIPKLMW